MSQDFYLILKFNTETKTVSALEAEQVLVLVAVLVVNLV